MAFLGHQASVPWHQWSYLLWVVVPVLALLAFGIYVLVWVLASRSRLWRAEKALKEQRLADALRLFRKVARMEFVNIGAHGPGSASFDDAMLGIVTTYSRAGKTVDLQPVRDLRAELKALLSDPKYYNPSAKKLTEYFTEAGRQMYGRIISEARAVLDRLPPLDR